MKENVVGIRVKACIDSKGISQAFLAKKIGITNGMLSEKLQGKRKMSAEELFDICDSLDVSSDIFRPKSDEHE